jgi:GH15 family glucan-1,4-alpha-glucosidase
VKSVKADGTYYSRIDEYGVIGDLYTAALVGTDGSIDWLCLPHFDSPSVFAAMLDARRGGQFKLGAASAKVTRRQLYVPDTNVLITRFQSADAVGER